MNDPGAQPDPEAGREAEPRGAAEPSPKVLVADDNDDIRSLLSARLTVRGFDVVTAADGKEALDAAREHLPDVIVLDWVMPIIQGHELCVKLKTDPRTQSIPVMMLTARGEEEDRLLGMDLGADAYMVKPFDIDELERTLRRLLDDAAGGGPANDLHQLLF